MNGIQKYEIKEFLKNKIIATCYASDDGAALHYVSGELKTSVAFYKNAKSYHIKMNNKETVQNIIPTIDL